MKLTDEERETIELEISEKCWDKSRKFPGVIHLHMLNAANYAFDGVYQFEDGREVCFKGQCGDIHGFIIEYSEELFNDELPKPKRYKLVPIEDHFPEYFVVSFINREDNQKLLNEANYDLFFSPTCVVRQYYDNLFEKKGLRLELDV